MGVTIEASLSNRVSDKLPIPVERVCILDIRYVIFGQDEGKSE